MGNEAAAELAEVRSFKYLSGGKIQLFPYTYNERTEVLDFSQHLKSFLIHIEYLDSVSKIYVIEGSAGTGKSSFGRVLEHELESSVYLAYESLPTLQAGVKLNIFDFIDQKDIHSGKTFIVDEAQFFSTESLCDFFETIINKGGCVVLLVQNTNDFDPKVIELFSYKLKITRNRLLSAYF